MSPTLAALADPATINRSGLDRRASSSPGLRVLAGGSASELAGPIRHRSRRRMPLPPMLPVAYRGSYLRRLLAPRRPVEQALLSVIQEAYLAGAGTRSIDALAETVGVAGKSTAQAELQAREWDARVEAFRTRPLRDIYPYLTLVETPVLVRTDGGADCCQVVVAVGRTVSGDREVVAFDVRRDTDGVTFWQAFLSDLHDRGLHRLEIVTADVIDGFLPALASVFAGARWQRCRESFLEAMLRLVPMDARGAVAASLRAIFGQPDAQSALDAVARARAQYEFSYPELVDALDAPLGSLLTFYQAAPSQRRSVSSLSALASLSRELRQCCQLIGIFPQRRTLVRLCGAVLQEISDEWAARATPRRRPRAVVVWEARLGSVARREWAAA